MEYLLVFAAIVLLKILDHPTPEDSLNQTENSGADWGILQHDASELNLDNKNKSPFYSELTAINPQNYANFVDDDKFFDDSN